MNGPGPAEIHARRKQEAAQAVEYDLRLLRSAYRDEFTFGHDPERGYWVIKGGSLGTLRTASTPGKLAELMKDAFGEAAP